MSDDAKRATKIGAIVVACVAGVLLIGLVGAIFLIRTSLQLEARRAFSQAPARVGSANLMFRGRLPTHFSVRALMDLPPNPRQRQSPSIQIAIFQKGAGVQAGIMRPKNGRDRLAAFVGYNRPGRTKTTVRFVKPLENRPHAIALSGDGREIVFLLDGVPAYRFRSADFFDNSESILTLGTQVDEAGDEAAGTMSAVDVRANGSTVKVRCVFSGGGIVLTQSGEEWQLHGRFNRAIPYRYENC